MASLLNTQELPHDLALAPTPNTGPIESRSPAIRQLSVFDGDSFEKDFLSRLEMASYDRKFPGRKSSAFKSSLMDRTRNANSTTCPATFQAPSLVPAAPMAPQIESNPETFLASDSAAYVAIDPFVPSVAKSVADFTYSSHLPTMQPQGRPTKDQPMPAGAHRVTTVPTSSYIVAFVVDTLPRQIYLYLLLTLPSLYFSRVARIFEEAELSMPDIKKMIISSANDGKDRFPSATRMLPPTYYVPSYDSPIVARFKASWEQFVDNLMKEWKTLNLVSVLLLSAILTTLQIDGAITDPYTRYFAFLALECSLMSLLYGCIYIIRFNTMRRTHRAAEWAEEAQKTKTFIWWNVWVLLAMPAIWLSWSIIFYLTCIMTLLWRTGTTSDTLLQITPLTALGPRLSVTFTFILGLVYLCLIIREFRRYGDAMDKAWRKKVNEWKRIQRNIFDVPYGPSSQIPFSQMPPKAKPKTPEPPAQFIPPSRRWSTRNPPDIPHGSYSPEMRSFFPSSQMPPVAEPRTSDYPSRLFPPAPLWLPQDPVPFDAVKIVDLCAKSHLSYTWPWLLEMRDVRNNNWNRFILDVSREWDETYLRFQEDPESSGVTSAVHAPPQDVVAQLIALWNVEFFLHRGTQAVLCEEQTDEEPTSFSYAIYLIDLEPSPNKPSASVEGEQLAHRFGKIPAGIKGIDLYDPVPPYGDIQKPTSRPLHVDLPPSRQRDYNSSPRVTWAPEDPDKDEKSSNDDRFEHGGRVLGLYVQPAIESTRQEPIKDTTTEEEKQLPALPGQEFPQEEMQRDTSDLEAEEYNLNRVSDSEAWSTMLPLGPRLSTSVDDPTKPTIYTTLLNVPYNPSVFYDLRFFPNQETLSFPVLQRNYNHIDFAQLATRPPVEQMLLRHPLLPWYIDVRQSQPNGVTVEDVVMHLFWELQLQIRLMEYYNEEMDDGTRQRIARAFERRTHGNEEEWEKGIKRVDYLEDRIVFVGLVSVGEGLWEVKTI